MTRSNAVKGLSPKMFRNPKITLVMDLGESKQKHIETFYYQIIDTKLYKNQDQIHKIKRVTFTKSQKPYKTNLFKS